MAVAWILLAAGLLLIAAGIFTKKFILKTRTSRSVEERRVNPYQEKGLSVSDLKSDEIGGFAKTKRSKSKTSSGKAGNKAAARYRQAMENNDISQDNRAEKNSSRDEALDQKKERLNRVNEELDDLIEEIVQREKVLKRKVQSLDREQAKIIRKASFKERFDEEYNHLKQGDIPDHYRQVIDLHEEGKNREEIAESLGLGLRETELIIKMHGSEEADDEG